MQQRNPFFVTPKGSAKYVTEQEFQAHRRHDTLPRDIEREVEIEPSANEPLPPGYSIEYMNRNYHVYFHGEPTGKYGTDPRKAREIISRMQDGKVVQTLRRGRRNPANDGAGSALVKAAVANTVASLKQGPGYLIRPAGSYVEGQPRDAIDPSKGLDIARWLQSLNWTEVTDRVRADGAGFGEVRYFEGIVAPSTRAYEAVCLWKDLPKELQSTVKVVEAHHKNRDGSPRYELVTQAIRPQPTNIISIAVGHKDSPMADPDESGAVVYTWYPGKVTPVVVTPPEQLMARQFHPMATVKLEG
jgi:hypothetical protein